MSRSHTDSEPAGCSELLAAARRGTRAAARRTTAERGEYLLRQGDPPRGLVILASGLGRVSTTTANGREILFGFVGPGEVIGEVEYFVEGPIRCTVEAAVRTEAWFIPTATVRALLAEQPRLALPLARTMARRWYREVERTSERITYPIAHSVLRICLARMSERGEPCIQLPKRDLAKYLGTSGRHLNRVLKDLANHGAIEVDRGQVRRVHPEVARSLVDDRVEDA